MTAPCAMQPLENTEVHYTVLDVCIEMRDVVERRIQREAQLSAVWVLRLQPAFHKSHIELQTHIMCFIVITILAVCTVGRYY